MNHLCGVGLEFEDDKGIGERCVWVKMGMKWARSSIACMHYHRTQKLGESDRTDDPVDALDEKREISGSLCPNLRKDYSLLF